MRKRVLIACEESQVECMMFRYFGAEAFSCDLKPTSGPCPEYHFQCDVLDILYYKWDLVIAHPPCTFLSNANPRPVDLDLLNEARDFWFKFWELDCSLCIENPKPKPLARLPHQSFILSPHQCGSDFVKWTYYWTKGLSPLFPTSICLNPMKYVEVYRSSEMRSKSFPEVAALMAYYWL